MPEKNDSEIEVLIEKLHKNRITAEEFKILEHWYSHSAADPLIWDLKESSRAELRAEILDSINSNRLPKTNSRTWITYAAAAAVIILVGLSLMFRSSLFQKQQFPVQLTTVSAANKITKVYLADHSIVWLKGNSRLDYPSAFTDSIRNVRLTGEALFEVAKDKHHPFIITTSNYRTRVLGTSFNINENQQGFKLTVLTGRVEVTPVKRAIATNTLPLYVITPGKQFTAGHILSRPQIKPVIATVTAPLLEGTEYDMNFANTSFEEVKVRIEKKFNVKINTLANAYTGCILSANVTDQSLENTLLVIGAALNANISTTNNQINFTGGGCN